MVTSLENLVKERASTQMCNLAKMFDSTLFTPQSVSFLIDYNWFPVPGSLKTNKFHVKVPIYLFSGLFQVENKMHSDNEI